MIRVLEKAIRHNSHVNLRGLLNATHLLRGDALANMSQILQQFERSRSIPRSPSKRTSRERSVSRQAGHTSPRLLQLEYPVETLDRLDANATALVPYSPYNTPAQALQERLDTLERVRHAKSVKSVDLGNLRSRNLMESQLRELREVWMR